MKIEEDIYDIRIKHERVHGEDANILSNGGRTVAYMFDIDGNKVETYANCSLKDSYNKKLGRIIALGRMLKLLELNTHYALNL